MTRPANHPSVIARFLGYLAEYDHLTWNGTRCHIWTGGKSRGGDRWSEKAYYGTFNPGGDVKGGVRAHVFIAWLHGIIPELKVPKDHNLDHRCRRALCCNPLHLELVTSAENQRRRIEAAHYISSVGFLAAAIGAVLASPKVIDVRESDLTKLNAKRVKTGKPPLPSLRDVLIRLPKPNETRTVQPGAQPDDARRGKVRHMVTLFTRLKRGKIEVVSPHWRGDASLGIKLPSYFAKGS